MMQIEFKNKLVDLLSWLRLNTKGYVLGLIVSLLAQYSIAQVDSLTPAQKAQVQFVGQSLLMAKRKADLPNAEEAQKLRQAIDALQSGMSELLAPEPVGQITIATEASSPVGQHPVALSTQTVSPLRQQRLNTVYTALNVLQKQCDTLQKARQPKTLWQRTRSLFAGQGFSQNNAAKHPVLTVVSDEALAHLAALGVSINEALALPAGERQRALQHYQRKLIVSAQRFTAQSENMAQDKETTQTTTPTLTTRTSHRRQF